MHRLIFSLKWTPTTEIDHKNGNGLDNRRENLRIATRSQNAANRFKRGGSSKFKGVCIAGKRWKAGIRQDGKSYHLGTFDTEEEAALAYNASATIRFGEFARLNEVNLDFGPNR